MTRRPLQTAWRSPEGWGWLYEVLSPHAERVLVTAVRESRGPEDAGHPGEAWVGDAFGLAEALWLGAIERAVYQERGGFGELGSRARGYRQIRDDGVWVRNRLKSVSQSRGVAVCGTAVYTASKREAYLMRLPRGARPRAELPYGAAAADRGDAVPVPEQAGLLGLLRTGDRDAELVGLGAVAHGRDLGPAATGGRRREGLIGDESAEVEERPGWL